MDQLPESPVPAGPQAETPADTSLPVVIDPMGGSGLSELITDIADSSARSMGSGVVPRLIAGHVRQLTAQLNHTGNQLQQAQSALAAKNAELGDAKTELALARREVAHAKGTGNVQLVLNSFGLVLLGVGIELFQAKMDRLGWIVCVLAVALYIAGWILPLLERKK
jgi:hypothetical protein